MQQEEMSFWDHLEELRWTLFRCILALFIFAIAGFSVMPWLFDNVVMAPCSSDFIVYREMCKISSHFSFLPDFCNDDYHVDIVNIKLASQFFTHMTCSFWLALLLTFPYLVWEVWKFVSPALYENEIDVLTHPGDKGPFDIEDIAKACAESEFEQYRIIQDRLYQSDFDRLVASTEDKD